MHKLLLFALCLLLAQPAFAQWHDVIMQFQHFGFL